MAKAPSTPTPKPAPKPQADDEPTPTHPIAPAPMAPARDVVIASVAMPDPDVIGLRGLIIPTGTIYFDGAFDKNATITIQRHGEQLEVTLNTNADTIPAGSWRPHD